MTDATIKASDAAKVYTEVHDQFKIDSEGMWFGSILAKNNILLSQKSKLIGSYASLTGQTKIDSTATVIYVRSAYSID